MTDNPLAEWLRARERDHRQDGEEGTEPRPPDDARDGGPTPGSVTTDAIQPPTAPWDDVEAEEPARPRRRWAVFTAALVPWVAAGLVVAMLGTGDDAAPPRSADTTGRQDPAERGTSAASEVPPAKAAVAVLAVHTDAVGSPVTDTEEGAPPLRRYVDLAVAEGLTRVDDVAVVTVAATVLEGTAEEWQRARPARFGVAVRDTDDGPVAVGRPWPLPGPAPAGEEPAWQRVEIDAEPIEAALVAAGYERLRGLELFRSEAVPGVVRAECRAVAPGEASPRAHAVWVADETTPAVLGDLEPISPVRRPETPTR